MSDITDSEQRLIAALDRIDYGLQRALDQRPTGGAALEAAHARITALEAENAALQSNRGDDSATVALAAQIDELTTRLEQADQRIVLLQQDNRALTARLADAGQEAVRLAEANDRLTGANRALLDGQGDGQSALQAEIDALSAARNAEIAQLQDIMRTLEKMLRAPGRAPAAPYAADVPVQPLPPAELVNFPGRNGEED